MTRTAHLRLLTMLLLLCLPFTGALAQEVRTVTGEYTYYGDDNTTKKEAVQRAIEGARLQALAKAFGTTVTQTLISDETLDGSSENTFFKSLSETEVKGEWIEDIGEPEIKYEVDGDGNPIVHCRIKGRARELSNKGADFEVAVLRNGTELRNADTRFRPGDDMRIYFKAPVDGYVAIYLTDDNRMAYTLLPYSHSEEGYVKVKHGKEYVFFDSKLADSSHGEVDEMQMTTDKAAEHDRFYILFSPKPFIKANDAFTSDRVPRSLTFNEFHRWLAKTRKNDPYLSCKQIDIVINGTPE